MRKQLSFLVVLAALLLVACSEKTIEDTNFGKVSHQLNISVTSISLGAETDLSSTFTIEAENTSWEILDIPSWLTISLSSGSGTTAVTVTALKTTSADESRMAVLKIRSTEADFSITKELTITQNALGFYVIPMQKDLSFNADASSIDVKIQSNVSWKAECGASWVSLSLKSDSILTIDVTENLRSDRKASIFLKQQGQETTMNTIEINQDVAKLTFDKTSLSFSGDGETISVLLNGNISWEVIECPSWITCFQKTGEAGTKSVEICTACNANDSRSGEIKIGHANNLLATLTVNQGATTQTDREFTVTGNGKTVTFKMVWVQCGMFNSSHSLYETNLKIKLTKNYFVGETEVTQALWYAVMGDSPGCSNQWAFWNSNYGLGDDYPAYYLSYEMCEEFIAKLNEMTGQNFRFLTTAEWKFAAQGGNKSGGYIYAGSNNLDEIAWYKKNSQDKTHPVKMKKANELGIYDMTGNVSECSSDWFDYEWGGLYYISNGGVETVTDPKGPDRPVLNYHFSDFDDYYGHARYGGSYDDEDGDLRNCLLIDDYGDYENITIDSDKTLFIEDNYNGEFGLRIGL